MRIDIEDMALLEDEVSQLRSENEYLRIALDGANHENAQLKATVQALKDRVGTLTWQLADPAASMSSSLAVKQNNRRTA